MSGGKRKLVGPNGARSTCGKNAPKVRSVKNLLSNSRFVKNHFCNVNVKNFCYFGKLDGRDCLFKIDTGSDVSIVSNKLVEKEKEKFLKDNSYLKYPTGEKVPFEGTIVV